MDYKTFIKRAAQEGFSFTVKFDDGEWISPEGQLVTDPQEVIDDVKSVEMCVVRLMNDKPEQYDFMSSAWVGSYLMTAFADNPEESIIDYNSNSGWVERNELIAQFA